MSKIFSREEREELIAENDKLRYLLAKGNDPCIYCGLPKADVLKCQSGFPGCGRADDLMAGETMKVKTENKVSVVE
jgi:hypothetical protein